MKKIFRRLWGSITAPFVLFAVILDESRRVNEDGSWDNYNRRRNVRGERSLGK